MPELPEVEALAAFLRERALDRTVMRIDVASFSAVKTFDPPLTALYGAPITGAGRHGKFLDIDVSGLHLITHFSRAGWLQWRDSLPAAPPRPGGKGPIALRLHLAPEFDEATGKDGPVSGFDLTEAGTQKRLAVYLVRDPAEVPGIARLGPDALDLDEAQFAELLRSHRAQVKGVITDQNVLAGIGNAYSDEILHAARLSPFKNTSKLTDDELARLFAAMRAELTEAVQRSVGQKAATLKGEKRSGLAVHGKAGLPCPVCGDTIGEVSFASKSFQYCPTCQTEGRGLADRRMSRLLK
ncbi:formamidopyrimidine-DNA glycosylase [Frankineae bacterium MT45]|nr:formamidopyrimidine-DNA glycosylase [Frankineae bacterium MT45]